VNTNKPSQKKNKLSKQNGASSCWHAAPIPQDHMRRSVIKDQGDALGAPKRPMSSSSWRVLKYVHHGTGFFRDILSRRPARKPQWFSVFFRSVFVFAAHSAKRFFSFSKLASGNGMPNSQRQINTNAVFLQTLLGSSEEHLLAAQMAPSDDLIVVNPFFLTTESLEVSIGLLDHFFLASLQMR